MTLPDPLPIQPIDRFEVALSPPGSKSLTNRALLLAALGEGRSRLTNVLFADDSRVMLKALQDLGFDLTIHEETHTVEVEGCGGVIPAQKADLSLGNAGTAIRFLTAACCLGEGEYTLDGIPRMRERPIGQLVEPLRHLGADIEYLGEEGYPPLKIRANGLTGGTLAMAPTLSSQYISALLQIGPCCENGIRLEFGEPVISWPYVEMTLRLMERFGAAGCRVGEGRAFIETPSRKDGGYAEREYHVEPDASNASYFLAAAAVSPGSSCTITGLDADSLQGDVGFAGVLEQMGARVEYGQGQITAWGPDQLRGVDVNLNAMPDMAQTLAVVALFAQGETIIRDIGNLRVKETDRLEALRVELGKL
ncbi:MAG: 3-phosphoshikimate 1-carboxyvinyltransferase, partial [Planctomycetota bacterium]